MATRKEELRGVLSLDNRKFIQSLNSAAWKFRHFAAGISAPVMGAVAGLVPVASKIQSITSSIMGVVGTVAKWGAGIGAAATAAGVAGIKDISDLGGKISDVSAITGMAADKVAILMQLFETGGAGADAMAGSVSKMFATINKAPKEGEASIWDALGLDQTKLKKADALDAINAIFKAVRQVKSPQIRSVAMKEIFGKSGPMLLPIALDPDGIKNVKRQLGQLPATMKRISGELDTVSDFGFGSIIVKTRQFFAGMAESIMPFLLEMTKGITNLDLTGLGRAVGAQLYWGWQTFLGIVQNGNLFKFLTLGLVSVFASSAEFLISSISLAIEIITTGKNRTAIFSFFKSAADYFGIQLYKAFVFATEKLPGLIEDALPPSIAGAWNVGKKVKGVADRFSGWDFMKGMFEKDPDPFDAKGAAIKEQERILETSMGENFEFLATSMDDSVAKFVDGVSNFQQATDESRFMSVIRDALSKVMAEGSARGGVLAQSPAAKAGGMKNLITGAFPDTGGLSLPGKDGGRVFIPPDMLKYSKEKSFSSFTPAQSEKALKLLEKLDSIEKHLVFE